jgi:N-sulfoglucosamine sulfohydrolase
MKQLVRILIVVFSFALLIICTHTFDSGAKQILEKPNVLFAISDDQGYPHTSANGAKFVKTPGFDRMAKEGLLFQNVYCAVPQCSPNRASILTGRYLWQNYEAGTHASLFPANLKVFTDYFIEEGYHLGSTGKPWAPGLIDKTNRLKNKNLIGKYYNAENQSEYWKEFQKFLKERENDEPFFFWFGTYDPHRPYKEGSGLAAGKRLKDVDVPPYLPDTDIVRSDFLDYAVMIERFDSNLVKMIAILEDMGELDNTLIIVTSDNGMPYPRAKGNAYDAGVRVPMAIRWGNKIPAGYVIDDLISHIDFAPTLLSAANLPVYPEIEGKSFMDVLLNPDSKKREAFRESLFYGRERATSARPNNFGYPVRTIRTQEYELVWNMKPDRFPVGDRFHEAEAAADVMKEIMGLKDSPQTLKMYEDALGIRPEFELHDMKADPHGLTNLANDPVYREVFDSLLTSLKEQLVKNEDPRLHGQGDIWESYPRFMGIRKFGGDHPASRGVYNENYVQEGQRIPQYLLDSKHYKAFFEETGTSKNEYIEKLLAKGAIIY